MMTKHKVGILPPLVMFLVLSSCDASSQLGSRLSPSELGTYEYMKPYLDKIVASRKAAMQHSQAWDRAEEQISNAEKAYEAATADGKERHSRAMAAGHRLLQRSKKGYWAHMGALTKSTEDTAYTSRTLVYPSSMAELMGAYRDFTLMGAYRDFTRLRGEIDAESMPGEDQRRLLRLSNQVVQARSTLVAKWMKRKPDYSHLEGSSNLNIQIAGVPIKLDIIDGEFKLSWSGSIGPLKTTFDTGGARGSIRTLIVQDGERRQVFAVGGRPLRIELPESILETRGSVMTITAK